VASDCKTRNNTSTIAAYKPPRQSETPAQTKQASNHRIGPIFRSDVVFPGSALFSSTFKTIDAAVNQEQSRDGFLRFRTSSGMAAYHGRKFFSQQTKTKENNKNSQQTRHIISKASCGWTRAGFTNQQRCRRAARQHLTTYEQKTETHSQSPLVSAWETEDRTATPAQSPYCEVKGPRVPHQATNACPAAKPSRHTLEESPMDGSGNVATAPSNTLARSPETSDGKRREDDEFSIRQFTAAS
jgi:hypothetical protein